MVQERGLAWRRTNHWVTDEPKGGAALLGFGLLCLAGIARRREAARA